MSRGNAWCWLLLLVLLPALGALDYAGLQGGYTVDVDATIRRLAPDATLPAEARALLAAGLADRYSRVFLRPGRLLLGRTHFSRHDIRREQVDGDAVVLDTRWQADVEDPAPTQLQQVVLRPRYGALELSLRSGGQDTLQAVLRRSAVVAADEDDSTDEPVDGRSVPWSGSVVMPWGGWGWVPLVSLAIQAVAFLHLVRTRGEWRWLWPIIILPPFGALAYLLWHRAIPVRLPAARLLALPMLERFDLGRAERAFRQRDSLDHRIAYGEALLARGRAAEALALYASELDGPLRDNVVLRFAHAKACYALGLDREAVEALERAARIPNNEKVRQRCLLLALCRARLGDAAGAEEAFIEAQGGFLGEEARCRYGLFLEQAGRHAEARRWFAKVVESADISTWSYRREQAFWITTARQHLAKQA